MTEPEDIEDDLFADLYEGDDFSKGKSTALDTSEGKKATSPENQLSLNSPPETTETVATAQDNHQTSASNDSMGVDWEEAAGQEMQHLEHEHEEHVTGIKEDGKMFIGGLNWETNDQALKEYFSQFGEVVECTVMRDGASGRSRGFGFLTFKDPKTVNIVMVKEHYLGGKIIDPKRAIPRDEQERTSKIFVGGVSQDATEDDFKNYFMQFGRVLDATLMIDKDTGRPRGFGFVTFDSENAVDTALASNLEIHGKPIEVKKAQPRGNVQNEEPSRHSRRGGEKGNFGNEARTNDQSSNQQGQAQQGNGGFAGGMTPQVMAQYWQKMQTYFAMMQSQMAAANGMGNQMGMGGMNPAMMAQMQQMQQMQSQNGGNMTPQMMQMMQQMQGGMQQGAGGFGGQVPTGPAMGGNGGNGPASGPGYNAYEQQMFEQQKYEQQQARRSANQQYQQYQGGPTSWEGMYDDVPQPNMGHQGGGGGRGNFGRHTPNGPGGRGSNRNSQAPTPGPASAPPANAPTGPKNAGRPGANYRGGGRNNHRGFHPYSKG